MKSRMFRIKIETMDEMWRNVEQGWKLTSEGKIKQWPDRLTLSFADLSMVAKVLSKERIRLLQVVREKKPTSVNQLAMLLGRSQQNVHKDVHYLADMGILDLKKNRKKGSKKESVQPEFRWDGFDIAV